MGILEEIQAAEAALIAITTQVIERIKDLPDNPRIERHGGHGFVMKISSLEDSWNPRWHDFKFQYRAVSERLENESLYTVVPTLQRIINEGKLMHPRYGSVQLHPDVVEHLRGVLQ